MTRVEMIEALRHCYREHEARCNSMSPDPQIRTYACSCGANDSNDHLGSVISALTVEEGNAAERGEPFKPYSDGGMV